MVKYYRMINSFNFKAKYPKLLYKIYFLLLLLSIFKKKV